MQYILVSYVKNTWSLILYCLIDQPNQNPRLKNVSYLIQIFDQYSSEWCIL